MTKTTTKRPRPLAPLFQCFTCQGTGGARGKCTDCDGKGWVR